VEGIASERPRGDPDLEVIVESARSLQASSLKFRRLPLASCGVMHVSQVVEDPVGGPIVLDPRVELEGAIAMFEGSVEISDCPSRHPKRHMSVGDPRQALGVRRRVEGADEVGHRLSVLAQSVAAAPKICQHAGTQGGIALTALIKPIEGPSGGFDGGVESLLDLE